MEKAWALLWTECRPAFRFPRRIFRFTSTAGSRDRTALPQNRKESDTVQILSGTFEGKTTGTPISMVVWNEDQHSKDYSDIASYYRPGHADYTFDAKYGFRDYRGGGRSSGRETIARVAAGAIALKMLSELGITVSAYTRSIGDVEIQSFDAAEIANNALNMPDAEAAEKASELLTKAMAEKKFRRRCGRMCRSPYAGRCRRSGV